MTNGNTKKRALVTGGAGLIGSHLTDLLLQEGYAVRVLDNLEPQTHRNGKPPWVPDEADFVEADIRDREAVTAALDGRGPRLSPGGLRWLHAGDGQVRARKQLRHRPDARDHPGREPARRESRRSLLPGCLPRGCGALPNPRPRLPPTTRPTSQLAAGDFAVRCPECDRPSEPTATPEEAPTGGETVYAVTKADQERLVLTWGRQTGIPAVALRYSCTYGPRQSIFNPYTGVIAIFCTRLLSGQPPVLYEDGEQTRDFSYVGDIARANLLAATTDKLDGMTANVGSGRGVTIREVAEMISAALDIPIGPVARGEFRPGEMRHLTPDVSRIAAAGYKPETGLADGIEQYLEWIKGQGNIRDYFAEAEKVLREKKIVQEISSDRTTR